MKILLFVFLGVAAARLSDEKCKEYYKEPRVKNQGLINEYPHMGILARPSTLTDEIKFICSATLISDSFVITPATCVKKINETEHNIFLGTSDGGLKILGDKILNITERIIYPKYSQSEPAYHNLALVKFSPAITSNDTIKPSCLYTKNVGNEQTLIDLFWAKFKKDEKALFKVHSSVYPIESCEKFYKVFFDKTIDEKLHLCAKRNFWNDYVQPIGGTLHVLEDGIPKIVGIDIYGPTRSTTDEPELAVKLFNYIDWIEKNVWKE